MIISQNYVLFDSAVRINSLTGASSSDISTSEYIHSPETGVALILATGIKPTGFFIPTREETPQNLELHKKVLYLQLLKTWKLLPYLRKVRHTLRWVKNGFPIFKKSLIESANFSFHRAEAS